MSWKDKMKEFGGGDLTFLSTDGEALIFIVVGEPELIEGSYKGKPSRKIACPVVTDEGFLLFIIGMRLARKLAKHEQHFGTRVFMAIRHGIEGDANASYELQVCDKGDIAAKLFTLKKNEFKPQMIKEALEAAREVLKQ